MNFTLDYTFITVVKDFDDSSGVDYGVEEPEIESSDIIFIKDSHL